MKEAYRRKTNLVEVFIRNINRLDNGQIYYEEKRRVTDAEKRRNKISFPLYRS